MLKVLLLVLHHAIDLRMRMVLAVHQSGLLGLLLRMLESHRLGTLLHQIDVGLIR